MIDWAVVMVPLHHRPIKSGCVCSVTPDGEIEWSTPKRTSVQGSYESSIRIRSEDLNGEGMATTLWISGNPSKFLQGHNVFGSDDLVALVYDSVIKIADALDITPNEMDLERIRRGVYPLCATHINYSFELPSQPDVVTWLDAASKKSRSRHGTPTFKGTTVTWGTKRSRWMGKAYSKYEEINCKKKGHKLPDELLDTPITAWCENKLRFEIELKGKELKEHDIALARDLPTIRVSQLFREYVGRIEMSEQVAMCTEDQLDLPKPLQTTYALWKARVDVRPIYSRAKFYRHRKEIKDLCGVDISLDVDDSLVSNVVPLIRVLEATPAEVPQWAIEENLVHPSARSNPRLA